MESSQSQDNHSTPRANSSSPKKQSYLMKSFKPTYSWGSTILLYFILGLLSIGYSLLISSQNNKIIEIQRPYDEHCLSKPTCTLPISISQEMKQPIFLYYGLDNFHQNYRTYIRSKSKDQLNGKELTEDQAISACSPAIKNKDLGVTISWTGQPLDPDAIASPCGLIAKTYFTDTFELWKDGAVNITLNDKNITWPKVAGSKYKRSADSIEKQWVDPENEHFINWMSLSGHANFKKLWAVIEQDLEAGDYEIRIHNRYDVSSFGGTKLIMLTTTSVFGSKNSFTSNLFLLIGVIFIGIAVFFAKESFTDAKKKAFQIQKTELLRR